jgi:hypothetical protein
MSNSPFDPNNPFSPWYQPPVPPQPVRKPIVDWASLIQPKPPTPSLADLLIRPAVKPPLFSLADIQPKRPRIFVSYQHSSDQAYYDHFSKIVHDSYESAYDNSLDRRIDSDDNEYVIQRIRDEFLKGSSCTIVLIGPTTYQRKFIDWEIKATLDKGHGLIGLQLPNVVPNYLGQVMIPERFNANINSGYAVWQGISWQQVISNPAILKHHIADACARSKKWIVNPPDIKKQNG